MSLRATFLSMHAGRRCEAGLLYSHLTSQQGVRPNLFHVGPFNVVHNLADCTLVLKTNQVFPIQKRFAKAIHRKGKTAPYAKRLFQSVLHPIMPEDVPERDWWRCRGMPYAINYQYSLYRDNRLDGMQQVILRMAKEELDKNSVFVVCQKLPCITNDFNIMAADVSDYGLRYNYLYIDRVMRVALENTPLAAAIIPLIIDKVAFFWSAEFDPVKLARAFKRLDYALPLAIIVDQQVILSRSQVERLAKEAPKGVFNYHSRISQNLGQPISTLASSTTYQLMQIRHNLKHIAQGQSENKIEEVKST